MHCHFHRKDEEVDGKLEAQAGLSRQPQKPVLSRLGNLLIHLQRGFRIQIEYYQSRVVQHLSKTQVKLPDRQLLLLIVLLLMKIMKYQIEDIWIICTAIHKRE